VPQNQKRFSHPLGGFFISAVEHSATQHSAISIQPNTNSKNLYPQRTRRNTEEIGND
jgi:hypothetical protein